MNLNRCQENENLSRVYPLSFSHFLSLFLSLSLSLSLSMSFSPTYTNSLSFSSLRFNSFSHTHKPIFFHSLVSCLSTFLSLTFSLALSLSPSYSASTHHQPNLLEPAPPSSIFHPSVSLAVSHKTLMGAILKTTKSLMYIYIYIYIYV